MHVMKLRIATILCLFFMTTSALLALPRPLGYLSDYAGLLNSQDKDQLESLLRTIEAGSGAEIAVVIQDSIDSNYSIEELALAYLSEWKVGKEGIDNGLILLLVVDESRRHGDYRFETGRGLEGDLPDGRLGQIGREELIPFFKNGDYAGGIQSAVIRIGEILGADLQAAKPDKPRKRGIPGLGILILFALLFLIFGGLGGGGRGMRRMSGGSDLLWLMLLGGMAGRRRGGGWSGGGFGGGNFGGGFGGFGGGGGGAGGGAGGSW
jgi:uncharacterized protein